MGTKATSLLSAVVLVLALVPTSSMAKNYECSTDHSFLWKAGRLVPQSGRTFSGAHDILHFNDETGDFWMASGKDTFLSPMPFKVVKKLLLLGNESFFPGNRLLAVYDGGDNKWNAGSTLRIDASDRHVGLVFLFDSTAEPALFMGKCHVYDKPIPPVRRNN
jgi:hypothetical protein